MPVRARQLLLELGLGLLGRAFQDGHPRARGVSRLERRRQGPTLLLGGVLQGRPCLWVG
jgi:hypothetical protein